jgi:WD40 repeat protein
MLQVWSGSTGQSLRKIKQEHVINRLVFSPQGTLISTASEDGTVCVFRVASGVEVFRVKHQGEAVSVAFSPDGEYLASAGQDSTARIWEVPEGYEVARVLLPGLPTDVGYTNGGRDLATTSDDGAARVWMWRPEDLIAELCARLDRNLSKEEWRQYLACIIHKSEAPKSFFVRVNNHEMASEFG